MYSRQYSITTALQVGQKERWTAEQSAIMQDVTVKRETTIQSVIFSSSLLRRRLLLTRFLLRVLPSIRMPCDPSILVSAADE